MTETQLIATPAAEETPLSVKNLNALDLTALPISGAFAATVAVGQTTLDIELTLPATASQSAPYSLVVADESRAGSFGVYVANESNFMIQGAWPGKIGASSFSVSNISLALSRGTVTPPNAKPQITGQPQTQAVAAGKAFTLTVTASGAGLSYQWSKNNAPISGQTGSSYAVTAASASDAGSYTVTITNSAGQVTSAPATITVS
jgi:hypothetical protein